MYCERNFKTKKELKAAVDLWQGYQNCLATMPYKCRKTMAWEASRPVRVYQPGPFATDEPINGTVALEGPHYPQPHKWHAEGLAVNGILVRVK